MKIAYATSGRSDESPLWPVVCRLRGDGHELVEVILCDDDRSFDFSHASAMVRGHRPGLMLLLGDRSQTLTAAHAAVEARVPIAHIHGGEVTKGCADQLYRDAISQMADIHFVPHLDALQRLASMGIHTARVHVSGAPGLENIPQDLRGWRTKGEYEKRFVVTYHPETRGNDASLLRLLSAMENYHGYEIVFTGVNRDPGWQDVEKTIGDFVADHKNSVVDTIPNAASYLSLCRRSAAVLGNSSSGVIEMATMRVPSVDVGKRQKGRTKPRCCVSEVCSEDGIIHGIEVCLSNNNRQDIPELWANPYDAGRPASEIISEVLGEWKP